MLFNILTEDMRHGNDTCTVWYHRSKGSGNNWHFTSGYSGADLDDGFAIAGVSA
jgi:hypothetical protein